MVEQGMQHLAHAAGRGRVQIRLANLAQHLGLTQNRGLQPAGHSAQMAQGLSRAHGTVEVGPQVLEWNRGPLGENRPDSGQRGGRIVGRGIDLGAVAGAQYGHLGQPLRAQGVLGSRKRIGGPTAALAHGKRRRVLIESADQQMQAVQIPSTARPAQPA